MANTNNNSVKTKNVVTVAGIVKENKLAVDKDKVNGSLVIQYGDAFDEQVEVSVYVGAKTSKGEHNKKYDTMKELSETLITQVNATDEKPVSTLRIYGKNDFTPSVDLYERYNENTDSINSNIQISMGFGNVYVGDIPKDQFKGEFDMVVYLTSDPKMEKKNDKKTGRLLVEGVFITYKGEIKPITFVVEDEELIEGIEECEKGQTINFWGKCKVAQITETKKKKSAFGGKAKTDTKTFTQRELLIEGGDPIDEDANESIDSELIKKGMVERETFLENLKKQNKEKDNKSKGKGGFGGKGKNDDNDIPF